MAWDDYYTYLEHKGLSPTTITSHRSSINRFILWIEQKETHMADSEELTILQKAFQKHIQLFKKSASRELKWKAGTINLTIRHLKQCFTWLLEQKLIPDNPAKEIKYIPENRLQPKWITEQQERKLFAELRLLLGNPKNMEKSFGNMQ
ncbi:phage integrase N-terminal SAM-like domain-containing protein [Seinonella peptonophila]|nr:phage integrase N-terminal SAM-like domain-containing protein [Seinonella peptonophila]